MGLDHDDGATWKKNCAILLSKPSSYYPNLPKAEATPKRARKAHKTRMVMVWRSGGDCWLTSAVVGSKKTKLMARTTSVEACGWPRTELGRLEVDGIPDSTI